MVHQQNAAGRKTHRARWIILGVVVVLAVVAGTFSTSAVSALDRALTPTNLPPTRRAWMTLQFPTA